MGHVRIAVALVGMLAAPVIRAETGALSPAEVRSIVKDAYVYGFPMVDNYRVLHAYCVDTGNPQYKGPWNQLVNVSRVFTPEDTAIQTPNSDTPYSMLGYDLRTEPLVITVPPIAEGRYFSLQFIDAYTFNFDYVGSRATGNGGGSFLLAGPGWAGETPPGIVKVIRSETELGLVVYRTQLFNPADIENVKAIQAGYKVQGLSEFLGQPAPEPAPAIDFIAPLSPDEQKHSIEFFNILNFALQFCPTVPAETELMARFAQAGIGAGLTIDAASLTPDIAQAFADGISDGWKVLDGVMAEITAGKVTSGDLFGTREHLNGNYANRFAAAILGIYGNSAFEAMYPAYKVDADGHPLDGAKNRYTIHFEAGHLPPVNAFWSVTMYKLPESLLYANPLNRYLINSPMLPDLKHNEDGSLTLYIQHDSPGADKEANWLPAPQGPFWCAMRLYWPKDEALNGTWKQPQMVATPLGD
mgnify:CR=1 FL=1